MTQQVQKRSALLREHILDVASKLFYRHGIRNVGVDRIISESGVARMTLYNHFKSKDLLIQEYLARVSNDWLAWYKEKIEDASPDPRQRVLAAFDVLDGWFRSRGFRGCSMTNAIVELGDDARLVEEVKEEHRHGLRAFLGELASEAGATEPSELAEELLVLLLGAMTTAQVEGPRGVARRSRRAAEHLLAFHVPA